MTIPTILTGIIISQGIYAGVLLLIDNKNQYANKFLGLLCILSSLWLVDSFLRISNSYHTNPDLYFMPIFYSFAFGPLIYLYTNAVTNKAFTFTKKHVYHFIPVLIQALFYIVLFWSSYSFKRWYWLEIHKPITYDLEFNLTLVSLSLYSFYSIRKVVQYQKWIKNQFSEISKINLNWLKLSQYALIIVCTFWFLETILREVLQYYAQQPISALSLSLSILVLATGALLQKNVTYYAIETVDEPAEHNQEKSIDEKTLALIEEEMKQHQYFSDPQLSLKTFSQHLNIPQRQVSFHINHGLKMKFIDFVNQYRIQLVKERINLQEYQHLTLNAIALESGFNSKSTFNRVFKNLTGQTPSEYKNKTQNTH